MKSKKILFVCRTLGNGGSERVVSVVAKYLCSNNCQVSIVGLVDEYRDYQLDSGIKYYPNVNDGDSKISKMLSKTSHIRRCVNEEKPDVVIAFDTPNNVYALFALLGSGVPVIVSERNDPISYPVDKFYRILRKIFYRTAAGFVFQTDMQRDFFSPSIRKKGVVISNPLAEPTMAPYSGERDGRVVCVSRLNEQKNIPLLLRAFSLVASANPYATLEIFGRGDLLTDLKKLAKQLNIESRVVFRGFSRNVHADIVNASVFVLPSNYEGLPNALMEAMALGIPSVSTNCPSGGPASLIQNGVNGFLVKMDDECELANAIDLLLNDKSLNGRISEEAIKIRDTNSSKEICSAWLRYIREITEP